MGSDGVRIRDHLLVALKAGARVKELDIPDFPAPAHHLWRVFSDLQTSRQIAQGALQPLTYTEIMSYSVLMGDNLEPWEVNLIKRLDMVYLRVGVEYGK